MVRTGLLVNPLSKVPNEVNYNSDEEEPTSEEDFDYLKWEL